MGALARFTLTERFLSWQSHVDFTHDSVEFHNLACEYDEIETTHEKLLIALEMEACIWTRQTDMYSPLSPHEYGISFIVEGV